MKPIGSDKLSTLDSDPGRPRVGKPPSPVEPGPERPAAQAIAPDLNHAKPPLERAPMGSTILGGTTDATSALDRLKEAIVARPQAALAAYRSLTANQTATLLSIPHH